MHDQNRMTAEARSESGARGHRSGSVGGFDGAVQTLLPAGQELELAAELLEITGHAELEEYLTNLIGGIGQTVGKPIRAAIGKPLRAVLAGVAAKVFPTLVEDALGTFAGPRLGTADRGEHGLPEAGFFELELQGLDRGRAELEVARRFVRFATTAAAHAAAAPAHVAPARVVRVAATQAAQAHAPGLLRRARRIPQRLVAVPDPRDIPTVGSHGGLSSASPGQLAASARGCTHCAAAAAASRTSEGRWERRGGEIVLLGG
jgi:hypothetical protein